MRSRSAAPSLRVASKKEANSEMVSARSVRMRTSLIVALSVLALSEVAGAQTFTSSTAGPGAPRLEPTPTSPEPKRTRPSNVQDPQGSVLASGILGVSTGSGGTSLVVGAGVGLAVFDGVVPGVRGTAVLGERLGGELAVTLSLTLPVGCYVVPFGIVEGGRRWLDGLAGWIVGVGGGARIGWPSSRIGFRIGWIWRRLYVTGASFDVSAPIVGVQLRW